MKINLFNIGSLTIHGYGFMIGIGFIIAIIVGCMRAKKYGLKDEAIIDIAIIAGVTGFIGAKLLFVIVNLKEFIDNPLDVISSSGFVVYGGIIAGTLCCMLYTKIKKLNFLDYFDIVMPEIAIAQGFGRIGCFLAGCCYGRETDSFIGVVFPKGGMAPAGVPLIPTQLFSAAGDFLIAAILIIIVRKKKLRSGTIGALYLVLYGVGRFIVEFFRADYRGSIAFLSTSQFISFFIVALGVTMLVFLKGGRYKGEAKDI